MLAAMNQTVQRNDPTVDTCSGLQVATQSTATQLSTHITTQDLYYHISQEVKPHHSNPYDYETSYTFTTPYAGENSNP